MLIPTLTSKKNKPRFVCPFCKGDIKSSSKTEIFYRSNWIEGCYECFSLSIGSVTGTAFQEKEYLF